MNRQALTKQLVHLPNKLQASAKAVRGVPGKTRALAMFRAMRVIGEAVPDQRSSTALLPQHVLSPPVPGSPSRLVAFIWEDSR